MSVSPAPSRLVARLLAAASLALLALAACSDDPTPGDDIPGCRLNSDCSNDQVCHDGACVEPAPCDGDADEDEDGCICTSTMQCGEGRVCDLSRGACVDAECQDDTACALGEVCQEGRCLADVDADRDRDGVPDGSPGNPRDNCPDAPNPDQEDADLDSRGDACDLDDDNDGVSDLDDACPLDADPAQVDADGDSIGNACDPDWLGVALSGSLVVVSNVAPDFENASIRLLAEGAAEQRARVDAAGGYVFDVPAPAPGTYQVLLDWPSWIPAREPAFALDGRADAFAIPPIHVQHLTDLGTDGQDAVSLSGQVRLQGQAWHEGTTVYVRRVNAQQDLFATLTTAEDGSFALPASPLERYELRFEHRGYLPAGPLQVTWSGEGFVGDDAQPINLTLAPVNLDASVTVYVTASPDWLPADQRGFQVQLVGLLGLAEQRADEAHAGVDPADDAEMGEAPATFSGLGGGTWLVTVARPGFALAQQTLTLDEQQPDHTLRLTLHLDDLAAARLSLAGQTLSADQLRATPGLQGANLSGLLIQSAEASPADLGCIDLRGANLTAAQLPFADLRGADLTDANLRDADLHGARLGPADAPCPGRPTTPLSPRSTLLRRVDMSSADLTDARFDAEDPPDNACDLDDAAPQVILGGARFLQTNFSGARLTRTNLQQADFSSAVLAGADLTGSCLRGASLVQTNLSATTLDDADLTDANLINAIMAPNVLNIPTSARRTSFARAAMTGAILDRADLQGAALVGANLTSATITGADLSYADASGANWLGATLGPATTPDGQRPTRLIGANLERGLFVGALFLKVQLGAARFTQAELQSTLFQGCTYNEPPDDPTSGTSFVGADLDQADLSGEALIGVDFTGAVMERVNLDDANLTRATFSACTWRGQCFADDRAACLDCSPAWPPANLGGASLQRATLSCARLTGANLVEADLTHSTIQLPARTSQACPSLTGAVAGVDLTNARLANAFWTRSSNATTDPLGLQGAVLDGVVLADANLLVDLTGASLVGVNLERTTLAGRLTRAELTNASALQCTLDADMAGAVLDGASFDGCDMRSNNLSGVSAWDTTFEHATFLNTDLTDAFMLNANIVESVLSDTNLHRADLTGVDLDESILLRNDLTEATLTRTRNAHLEEADLTHARSNNQRTGYNGLEPTITFQPGATTCPDGRLLANNPDCDAFNTRCGDGFVAAWTGPAEVCDDGNTDPGDGCSSDCRAWEPRCGNGHVDPAEACDDGNAAPGDGCDASCRIEPSPAPAPGSSLTLGPLEGIAFAEGLPFGERCASSNDTLGAGEYNVHVIHNAAARPTALTLWLGAPRGRFEHMISMDVYNLGADGRPSTCITGIEDRGGAVSALVLAPGQRIAVVVHHADADFNPADGLTFRPPPYLLHVEAAASIAAPSGRLTTRRFLNTRFDPFTLLGPLDRQGPCGGLPNLSPHHAALMPLINTTAADVEVHVGLQASGVVALHRFDGPATLNGNLVPADGCLGPLASGDTFTLAPGQATLLVASVELEVAHNLPLLLDLAWGTSAANTDPIHLAFLGSLDPSDPTWALPSESCEPADDDDEGYAWDAVTITNPTALSQQLNITATWQGDGVLRVFQAPFNAEAPSGCLAGNDDFNGPGQSRVEGVTIPPGGELVVVLSADRPFVAAGRWDLTIDAR